MQQLEDSSDSEDDDLDVPSPPECCTRCCPCCCPSKDGSSGGMRYVYLVATLVVAICWYGPPWVLIKYTLMCGAGLLVYLYTRQGRLLYVPTPGNLPRENNRNPPGYRSPEEHDLSFESVSIVTEDNVRLHAWLMTQPRAGATTLLLLHGNAGNIGVRVPNYVQLYHKVGVNMLALEYRGYGESENASVGERGLITDAKAALAYIVQHPDLDSDRVVVFGRSLGGAVAIALSEAVTGPGATAKRPPKRSASAPLLSALGLGPAVSSSPPVLDAPMCRIRGVILENTFTSIKAMAIGMFPFLKIVGRLLPWLLTSQWRSIDKVRLCRSAVSVLCRAAPAAVRTGRLGDLRVCVSAACTTHTPARSLCAAAPTPPQVDRIQVRFLLCTVILHANHAHNLTRSP